MTDKNNLNVQEILMKLVESNARIESKLDSMDRVICEIKKDASDMEHRMDDVEKTIEVIKTKLIVAAFIISVVVSLLGPYITKNLMGE